MAEYIEKQDIYDAIDLLMTRFPYKVPGRPDTYHPYNEAWESACSHALDLIRYHQPADVRPVRRGQWEIRAYGIDGEDVYCSVCKCGSNMPYWPFCPMCGADMRGGDAE